MSKTNQITRKTNREIGFINKIFNKKEILVACAAFFALIIALLAEKIGNIKPCKLCIFERYTYISLILFSYLSLRLYKYKILKYILFGNLVFLVMFSSYHVLYEKDYIKFSSICDSVLKIEGLSRDEIREMILKEKPVSCKTPVYVLKKISFAELNLYYSFLILVIFIMKKNEKN